MKGVNLLNDRIYNTWFSYDEEHDWLRYKTEDEYKYLKFYGCQLWKHLSVLKKISAKKFNMPRGNSRKRKIKKNIPYNRTRKRGIYDLA